MPRLTKKRPLAAAVDADEEGVEEEEEEEGVEEEEAPALKRPPALKCRPAAAPKAARKSAAAPATPKAALKSAAAPKSSGVATSSYELLLKKPARVARPPQSEKPTSHAGGRIYFSKGKGAYRVYLRAGDRIEKQVKANVANKADMQHKFRICCALIENDKRPIS